MTSTLAHHEQRAQLARDWAEIQERMLVPLYEAVYERVEVGPDTRLLGLGCGTGLALLLAAGRGAAVTGTETDGTRLELARARLLPEPQRGSRRWSVDLVGGGPADVPRERTFNLVTAFGRRPDPKSLAAAVARTEPGTPVVLADWGPAERCAATGALRVASRLAEPQRSGTTWRPSGRDDLEELAHGAGLRLDGSGRVSCPFGYADLDNAVRGLLSTGLFAGAVRATDEMQVGKELGEALQPYLRPDGSVWMPNLFRYVIARG
ncbi:SAM-dependent methyltransferase [Streptomyces sp. 549]|uniref:SAM-dependent methyltransferase n=1 Tax=Streptomyces sp. 549 TaxID=3049076 RepID=UPI0024C3DC4D|nr:SAM-dependent methyltransferase [Streptomyces sp. 549]MDK1475097.1 SAM-dependent methyltransferase [Streptomyces sp. 549]